jgi:sugar lactone lactonase YvrE
MNEAGKIISVSPRFAITGGEVSIKCEGFQINSDNNFAVFFDGQPARIVSASSTHILAIVPENFDTTEVEIYLENGGKRSEPYNIVVGKKIAEDMHIVANPAVDPKNGAIILTRSGGRGQKLPVTLFRLESDGYLQEMSADVLNPTGIAFSNGGNLFVTNRADGEVYRINFDEEVVPFASQLGIATGIAFDKNSSMFIGDRSGTIHKISKVGEVESFARLEPSVAAYHIAFGTDGKLYVSAPQLASFESVWQIDEFGEVRIFYRGLGRPQGIAFDTNGNMYIAACLRGKRGIVRITPDREAELIVAGMNVVGLCFTKQGEMIVATNEEVFSLPMNIYGTLL